MATQELIQDNLDATKKWGLDPSLIATGQTRSAKLVDRDVTLADCRIVVIDTSGGAQTTTFDGVEGELVAYRQDGANTLTINRDNADTFAGGATSLVTSSAQGVYLLCKTGTTIEVLAQPGAGGGASKYTETIGDGTNTTFSIAHNLGSQDVMVTVIRLADFVQVRPEVVHTSASVVDVSFSYAPTANEYRVIVFSI